MEPWSVCLATQTPLLQFLDRDGQAPTFPSGEVRLDDLTEGIDYRFSPGGVTRMVYPLAQRMIEEGRWKEVHWVALNPKAPKVVRMPGITLHHVAIDPERLQAYGNAKETIWTTVHGLRDPHSSRDLFWSDDYGDYLYYNRTTAELIRSLDRKFDFDVFYVHDFQLLAVGHMLGSLKPKVFRWHIPFDHRRIPMRWQSLIATLLASYDVVVVSADRYLEALRQFGHQGRVEKLYPYVDPRDYTQPTREEVETVAAQKGIRPSDQVALVVARMDPSKGQDVAIEALAKLAPRFPKLRLVLVGNGSFSSSRSGLGLSKSAVWRQHLEERARELGVGERVVFTGHVSQHELDSLYRRALFTVLPSVREGFGLVVVESWLHGKPTVVTERAGIADLIRDGSNGLLFDPDRPNSLSEAMERLLTDRHGLLGRLAENGRATAALCTLERAVEEEEQLLGGAVEA